MKQPYLAFLLFFACILIFSKTSLASTEDHVITPSTSIEWAGFGSAVAIDGNTAVIASEWEDNYGLIEVGAAYIFTQDDANNWTQQAKLLSSDYAESGYFGRSVSISGDTVVIGSEYGGGSAYVFVRDEAGNWSQQATLAKDPTVTTYYDFGEKVAIYGDTILVSASEASTNGSVGAVYVYTRDETGVWTKQARLDDGASNDSNFGTSLSIYEDTALIGNGYERTEGNIYGGAAYIFVRDDTGAWSQEAKLVPDHPTNNARFGITVSLSQDIALIGAPRERNTDLLYEEGAAYVFARDHIGNYVQQAKLKSSDISSGDYFGNSVSLRYNIAVIGCQGCDSAYTNTGAAYVFRHESNGNWSEIDKLEASDAASSESLGPVTYTNGDIVLIGSPDHTHLYDLDGQVYSFFIDTDGDGIKNNLDNDDDNDGLSDSDESNHGTNRLLVDTDGDSLSDFEEVSNETNPLDKTSPGIPLRPTIAFFTGMQSVVDLLVSCSNFNDPNAGDTIAADQWQIATDSGFTNLVVDKSRSGSDITDDGSSFHIDNGLLSLATSYWVRVRHQDQNNLWSFWSSPVQFITADTHPFYVDADSDGHYNFLDNCPSIPNSDQSDLDMDGTGDICDMDPFDPTVTTDTDGDGIDNLIDMDDDNDGTLDDDDFLPLYAGETTDSDGDFIGNNSDPDDDNDGVLDEDDALPLDPTEYLDTDGDGIGNNADTDDDGDGEPDASDLFPLDSSETVDTDGDGIGNNADADDDDDGLTDTEETTLTTDPLNMDSDGDRFTDGLEYYSGFDPADKFSMPGKIVALDAEAGDKFGKSVAVDGDIVAVGAYLDDDKGVDSGSVYIFKADVTGKWNQVSKLTASDGAAGDYFGSSVSMAGNTLLVGSPKSDQGDIDTGAVYIFEQDLNGTWIEQGKILASDGAANDEFGTDVLMHNGTAIIGAKLDDDNGMDSGSAYIFVQDINNIWTQQAKLVPSDGSAEDYFGGTVSVYADFAVIGAEGDDDNGSYSGSAYIFERDINGTWTQQEKYSGSMAGEHFGYDVSIFNNMLAVGATGYVSGDFATGGVYIYTYQTSINSWVFGSSYSSPDLSGVDRIGNSISVHDSFIAYGAEHFSPDLNQAGTAYTCLRTGNSVDGLTCKNIISNGFSAYDNIGSSTATDGATILIGAPHDDIISPNAGAVYVVGSDTDGDGATDILDAFPLDPNESIDTDHDGIGNNADTDDDGDGIPDGSDHFPLDSTESIDTDGDGIGNNADTDDDNDGIPDVSDAFPTDPFNGLDTDGDGIGDNSDTDDDNDGTPDTEDAFPLDPNETIDSDGDGIGNNADLDDDNDGTSDASDAFPLDSNEQLDTDGDGIGNNADADDDNDGLLDVDEPAYLTNPLDPDSDGDGFSDGIEVSAGSGPMNPADIPNDLDGDGIININDAFPLDPNESVDTDHDGIGNNADTDDDGDGLPDDLDQFPLDPTEGIDTDGDGIGNNADPDDDNDLVPDFLDPFPLDPSEYVDTDGDGIGNNADTDDDNDGLTDIEEAGYGTDPTSYDTDHDGFSDGVEIANNTSPLNINDFPLPPSLPEGKIRPADGQTTDSFGVSIAISANTLIVGAYGDDSTEFNVGSAYVYLQTAPGTWELQQKLTPNVEKASLNFGASVAIDGDTAIIGTSGQNEAYIFVRDGNGVWTQQTILQPSDGEFGDVFGTAVAIHGDTAIVGARNDADNGDLSGSAYIFVRDTNGNWSQQAKLTASNGMPGDEFGWSVAIYGDHALVGAHLNAQQGDDTGSAYFFNRDSNGNWSEITIVYPALTTWAKFGQSVSMFDDVAIVGAPLAGYGYGGNAYIYRRDIQGNWMLESILQTDERSISKIGDEFGYSVSIHSNTAVIGARYDDNNGYQSGTAFVFKRDIDGSWVQERMLSAEDGEEKDYFGSAVATNGDAHIAGAFGDDDLGAFSGSIYVFEADNDQDGVINVNDNCVDAYNPDQLDADSDSYGDACDAAPSDPNIQVDYDLDGIDDTVDTDDDNDGLLDTDEALYGTDPLNADSDSDGLTDGEEVQRGTGPLSPDSDGDGFTDGQESLASTDPLDSTYYPIVPPDWFGNLDLYVGGLFEQDTEVTGQTLNSMSSPNTLVGEFWTVNSTTLITNPGDYTIHTDPSGNILTPDIDFTVAQGQVALHLKITWGGSTDIDVINVYDIDTGPCLYGSLASMGNCLNYTNVDGDGDGNPGVTVVDGPYPGVAVNFNMSRSLPGDVAPYGNPDGELNAADLLIGMQIATGQREPTSADIEALDLYPKYAGDGIINLQDIILLQKLILQ